MGEFSKYIQTNIFIYTYTVNKCEYIYTSICACLNHQYCYKSLHRFHHDFFLYFSLWNELNCPRLWGQKFRRSRQLKCPANSAKTRHGEVHLRQIAWEKAPISVGVGWVLQKMDLNQYGYSIYRYMKVC